MLSASKLVMCALVFTSALAFADSAKELTLSEKINSAKLQVMSRYYDFATFEQLNSQFDSMNSSSAAKPEWYHYVTNDGLKREWTCVERRSEDDTNHNTFKMHFELNAPNPDVLTKIKSNAYVADFERGTIDMVGFPVASNRQDGKWLFYRMNDFGVGPQYDKDTILSSVDSPSISVFIRLEQVADNRMIVRYGSQRYEYEAAAYYKPVPLVLVDCVASGLRP